MYPDDEEEDLPTLTKWPFYLGDAVLVVLAVTIAILDGWQLDGIQVFACVLAVALGAALLVFPFVMEFQMFAREEKEDRAGEFRLLKKQLENLEAALLKQHERLNKLESRSGLDDQRYELLTSAIDQKTQIDLPDITDLINRIEAIESNDKRETKVSDTLKKELIAQEKSTKQIIKSLDGLQARMDILEKPNENVSVEATAKTKNEVAASEKRQKKKEGSLLKRAIEEKQGANSMAVSRIIDPNSKSTSSDSKAEATDSPKREEEEKEETTEVQPTQPKKPETDVVAQEAFSEIEQLPEDFSISLGADLMMDDDFFEVEETAKSKKSTAPKKEKDIVLQKKATGATSEKSIVTIVEVNKLMGIGNKPFLRGSGAGLNWEKGVEMEFQEIGRWTWSVVVSASETIELQVYRNDEDADRRGKLTLQAGQNLKIEPEF